MSKSKKLPQGKLPIEVLNPILDSMPLRGLPVSNRIGMDAGIVKLDGKNIYSSSLVVTGQEVEIGRKLVTHLGDRLVQSGSEPVIINPVVLLPLGTSEDTIKHILLEISKTAEDRGIVIGKGHTEITSRVRVTTLIGTIFGTDQKSGQT